MARCQPASAYRLRHAFATAAKRARLFSEARDRLLGHRPTDATSLYYVDEDQALPLLAEEIEKIPALLDDAVPAPGTSSNGTDDSDQQHDEQDVGVSYAIKPRTTPTIETEPQVGSRFSSRPAVMEPALRPIP